MNSLFDQIATVRPRLEGWASYQKCYTLASMVVALRPTTIVEIGVWGGASLLPMALACKEIGHGTIIGIDPWSAEASVQGQDKANSEWWAKVDHEEIYQGFMREVNVLGVQNIVAVDRRTSDAANVPNDIGILHTDGNHGVQALNDVKRFSKNVNPGGIIVLDDVHWTGESVQTAMSELLENGFRELYRVVGPENLSGYANDWAVFQRI